MKKMLTLLFLLPFISACAYLVEEFLIGAESDFVTRMCWNNFYCSADVPDGDSVYLELYSVDTLLENDIPSDFYPRLPTVRHEFRERLTLRVYFFCNGGWHNFDYKFQNKKDKYTRISIEEMLSDSLNSSGIQAFSTDLVEICPELSKYRVDVDSTHPPDCPQFN